MIKDWLAFCFPLGSHEQQLLCSYLACGCSTSDSFWKRACPIPPSSGYKSCQVFSSAGLYPKVISSFCFGPFFSHIQSKQPFSHAIAFKSLSRLHKLSWYFANCSCSLTIAPYIYLPPAGIHLVTGPRPFSSSINQPVPNADG